MSASTFGSAEVDARSLHKISSLSQLRHIKYPAQNVPSQNLGKRFDWLDKQLAGKDYLMGDKFTVADAYLFTVLRWTSRIDIDLAKWPNLKAYVDRVAARPKVQEALKAEGLIK